MVVLFSDGVSDHMSPERRRVWPRPPGSRAAPSAAGARTQEIVQEIFADLDRFNTERFDDQTLIVMRVK